MRRIQFTVEEGVVSIDDLPEGIELVVRNIDQDSGMIGEDVHETTFQNIKGEITRTKFEAYDLPEPEGE